MEPTTLEKSKKLAKIIIILSLVIFLTLMAVLAITNSRKTKPEITRKELILDLPHITKDYSIVYSENKDQIYVNAINPPYQKNKQKALDWLKTQGANISKLNIKYFP